MSDFIDLDEKAPATLEGVLLAVARLSTLTEEQILEIASSGQLQNHFAFRPAKIFDDIGDFVDENDLMEASPLPLSRQERADLIQSSMPTRASPSGATGDTINSIDRAYSEGLFRARRERLMRDLGVDAYRAGLLVQHGLSTLEEVASAPIERLESIEGLEKRIAKELQIRSQQFLFPEVTVGMPESFNILVKEIRSLAADESDIIKSSIPKTRA